jgi:tripartite-type tricarboxylate transporter receptor subunit TctC
MSKGEKMNQINTNDDRNGLPFVPCKQGGMVHAASRQGMKHFKVRSRAMALRLVSMVLLSTVAVVSHAQNYPSKAINVIVPFTPGGSADLVARTIGAKLSDSLGQPVVVENHGGAGGEVGVGVAVRARPDGYTLLITPHGPITVGGHFRKQPFDVTKDLIPVAMVAVIPIVFSVNAALPVKTLPDFIAYAKDRPDSINYSNPGLGSANHLAAEMLKHAAGIKMAPVPYKGSSAAAVAVASGEVHAGSGDMSSYLPFGASGSGKVRILATYGPTRSAIAPEVPTIVEAGLTNFSPIIAWIGAFVPAKTPPQIVARLHQEITRALQRPDVRTVLQKAGGEAAAPMSPEKFGQYVQNEINTFGKVIKAADIKVN